MPDDVCADKISELPDDLLVCILLLIPTEDAVATMVLSRRWRFVWTLMPKLEYKERKKKSLKSKKSEKSVWLLFNKSLELHKAPIIDSLCVELGPQCPTDVDVGEWVAKVVDRSVRKLIFELRWSANPISLHESLYTCETLVELELSHKILVDFPSLGCLPSLKKLCLKSVVYKDDASLVRFLSSCPVLEKLLVKRRKDDNVTVFSVKVPSLLLLSYYKDYSKTVGGLVIDTPALKHFAIYDLSSDYCFMENMPCLDSAYLDSAYLVTYSNEKLLRCLSSALSLVICYGDETLRYCSTINFPRLVKLHICPDESNWLEPLMLLLGNAPKLKYLLVDYRYAEPSKDLPLSWNQPNSVPHCLSSHLKIFEWKEEYRGTVEEKAFLTYILANSKCLKRATISFAYNLKEKQKMIQELESIPRVSKASQLLFN